MTPMIARPEQAASAGHLPSVSIVVPCFNEEAGLVHLRESLHSARLLLGRKYNVCFILVDDGSSDGTWNRMKTLFEDNSDCVLLRHPANLGIGAAILSGIRAAGAETVCSIDADCSYDPCELSKLIPMLSPGVDLVTASPYHPAGAVVGVPAWRLLLSKTASSLYRRVLRQKLYTYTSCFRVYRRSSILKLNLRHRDFLAMAEMVGRLDLQRAVIVECPATLATRLHGSSKMKTARVLLRHLHLLAELFARRAAQALFGRHRPFIQSLDFNEN